jgi:hypothetical protein
VEWERGRAVESAFLAANLNSANRLHSKYSHTLAFESNKQLHGGGKPRERIPIRVVKAKLFKGKEIRLVVAMQIENDFTSRYGNEIADTVANLPTLPA